MTESSHVEAYESHNSNSCPHPCLLVCGLQQSAPPKGRSAEVCHPVQGGNHPREGPGQQRPLLALRHVGHHRERAYHAGRLGQPEPGIRVPQDARAAGHARLLRPRHARNLAARHGSDAHPLSRRHGGHSLRLLFQSRPQDQLSRIGQQGAEARRELIPAHVVHHPPQRPARP